MFRLIRRWLLRPTRPDHAGSAPFTRLTNRARTTLVRAHDEATRLGSPAVAPEHLLLGLLRERRGVAGQVLTDLGVTLPPARRAVAGVAGPGTASPGPLPRLTPRARRVLADAAAEARCLQHPYLGTEHLLLALAQEGSGISGEVLELLGVRPETVRAAILRIVADHKDL